MMRNPVLNRDEVPVDFYNRLFNRFLVEDAHILSFWRLLRVTTENHLVGN